MLADTIAPATPLSLAEAKAWLRIETGEEDATIAAALRAATAHCERFTGLTLIARDFEEMLPATAAWRRLAMTPVSAILAVTGLPADGASFALSVDAYAIDIDANGEGSVRVTAPGAAGRIEVRYRAGLASDWNGVPESLRQGIVMLTAQLFERRVEEGNVPASAAALWRPYRRMRLR